MGDRDQSDHHLSRRTAPQQPREVIGIERLQILWYQYMPDDPTESHPKDTQDTNEGITPTELIGSSSQESGSAPKIGTISSDLPTTTEVEVKALEAIWMEKIGSWALNKPDDCANDCPDQNGLLNLPQISKEIT